jgi:hypothetical protein
VQDAESDQRVLDLAADASADEGIRQGLEDLQNGRTRPAREVFDELRAEYDIPPQRGPDARAAVGRTPGSTPRALIPSRK